MMTSNRRKENVAVDYNFCDEVMVTDMVNPQKPGDKLIAKWLLGFIKDSLNNKMLVHCYCASGSLPAVGQFGSHAHQCPLQWQNPDHQ